MADKKRKSESKHSSRPKPTVKKRNTVRPAAIDDRPRSDDRHDDRPRSDDKHDDRPRSG